VAIVVIVVVVAVLASMAVARLAGQRTAVDACRLVGADRISRLVGFEMSVQGAFAGPYGADEDSPWWTSCEYGERDQPPGRYAVTIGVYVDADFDRLVERLGQQRPGPEDLGDAARFTTRAGTTQLWVKQGSSVLDVSGYDHTGRQVSRAAVTAIARAAIERVPSSGRVEPVDTGRVCETIDLEAARAAAGAELVGRREISRRAATFCGFRGRYPVFLGVSIRTDQPAREEFDQLAARPDAASVDGLDAVVLPLGGRQLVALLKTRTAVFEVYLRQRSGTPARLTPEQRAFLESLTK
jgi:hypothetical protein